MMYSTILAVTEISSRLAISVLSNKFLNAQKPLRMLLVLLCVPISIIVSATHINDSLNVCRIYQVN